MIYISNPRNRVWSGRSDLDRLLGALNVAEGSHAVAAILAFPIAIAYARTGHTAVSMWILLLTVPVNVYPILLQRWVRGRIWRIQRRIDGPRTSIIGEVEQEDSNRPADAVD